MREDASPEATVVRAWVHPHEYRDSMVLMYLSAQLAKLPGVARAMAIMGTEGNRELLASVGLLAPEAQAAGPNDLVVAVRAVDDGAAALAAARLRELLSQRVIAEETPEQVFHSIEGAVESQPGSNLALISVPGQYAAREARRALDRGLHVFLFSDNVPLADEVALKRLGRERGLLVMGPDCGTAIVNGVALGFANVVRRGPIGIVGASGTGIQEVCALIDRAGQGISHALGTGGRDLSAEVGAATTLQAIDLLDADPDTAVLVVVSKLPEPSVAERVLAQARSARKPVVACLLGQRPGETERGGVRVVRTLAAAAEEAIGLAGGQANSLTALRPEDVAVAAAERRKLRPGQRFVRGLFSGGSLCEEAMLIWAESLGPVWSNVPLAEAWRLADPRASREHAAVDLGDDYFTAGRPHPMIDPTARQERLLAEAGDPTVAVVVLDVVLGYGSHPDMAGALLPTIAEARRRAAAEGRHLAVVAHVCGTEGDPQGLRAQESALREGGVVLAPSNAAAARLAALIARGDDPSRRADGSPRSQASEELRRVSTDCEAPDLLRGEVKAVNVGLSVFYRSLLDQAVPVAHVDWRPPAGGDPKLASLLERLSGRRPDQP